jgi:hypothetical protein
VTNEPGRSGARRRPDRHRVDWARPGPVRAVWFGGVAEWLGRGLQSPAHRFDSGPRLEAIRDRLHNQGA